MRLQNCNSCVARCLINTTSTVFHQEQNQVSSKYRAPSNKETFLVFGMNLLRMEPKISKSPSREKDILKSHQLHSYLSILHLDSFEGRFCFKPHDQRFLRPTKNDPSKLSIHSAPIIPLLSRRQTAPHAPFCRSRRPRLDGAADGGSQVFRPDPLQPAGALHV